MSFSGEMKEEIARLIPEKEEEVRAELMAIIRFCGRILRQEESVAVFMETENVVLAKTYVKLIKRAFDLQVQLEIRRHGTGKYNQYFILLSERPEDMLYSEERPERQKLQQALQAICMWSAQADPRGFLKTPGSMRAYIRGAFLCTGSMSDPGKSYHFEMVCEDEQTAQILKELMAGFFVHAKVILRKQRYIVYLKDSEEIIQILNVMEAHRSLITDEEEIKDLINNGKATFYIGFDPTADSLHVGHFMALCLMKRLQMAGNKPIALIGGGTAMVGDPSGRSDMRQMMTQETIQHNCDCFKKQMERFIDFSDGKALMVNNGDWLLGLNYVDFLREIGPHFSVNRMLTAECYKQRMEKGLSFLEFNYMLMQSYDFYMLYQKYGCNLQFGGDDQWSNMLGGTELIRRKLGKNACAMTITLLLNSEGKKMGKTQSGAVWLDPNKTSPFDFYQYWRNVADADVLKCIRMLTFLPLEQIDEMDKWEGSQLNQAKEILAYELTALVHGEEEAKKAQEGARALFSAGNAANMPSTTLAAEDFQDGAIDLISLLCKAGLVTSRSEGRRAIEQGGVSVDGEKITDIRYNVKKEDITEEGLIVKRGKKKFMKICL